MSFLVENHLSRRTIGLKYADENEDQHSNLNSKQCLHKTKNEYIKETIQQEEKEQQEELELLFEEKQCRSKFFFNNLKFKNLKIYVMYQFDCY